MRDVTRWVQVGVVVLCLAGIASASEAPTLSELQRLQIGVLVQRLEIAQLKAQLAQREFDAAKAELSALTDGLKVDGYELELQPPRYRAIVGK